MNQPSPSPETSDAPKQPPLWLQKHYQEKRDRTVRLVKASVDHLMKAGQNVTLEAICRVSSTLDPDGRGVKKSALLENTEAHAYYRQYSRSYQTTQARKRKRKSPPVVAQPMRLDPHRDRDRARYRYLQMTKVEIIERLLQVEQAYAELAEQQARLQFAWAEGERQASLDGKVNRPDKT